MAYKYRPSNQGFTLIELMIVVAIIAILGAIAIPAYNSYIDEASIGAARQNLDSMRIFVEDYRLENGELPPTADYANAAIDGIIGWSNETVGTKYNYTLSSDQAAGTYDAWVVSRFQSDSNSNIIWVRCENGFQTCCTSIDVGAGVGPAAAAAACP